MTVRTESVQFKADDKLIQYIEKKLGKLDNFFDKIIDASVKLKLENSGQIKDKIAEISIAVPGTVLFVKETHKTFEGSVDSATDNLKRQLKRYKEKLRQR